MESRKQFATRSKFSRVGTGSGYSVLKITSRRVSIGYRVAEPANRVSHVTFSSYF